MSASGERATPPWRSFWERTLPEGGIAGASARGRSAGESRRQSLPKSERVTCNRREFAGPMLRRGNPGFSIARLFRVAGEPGGLEHGPQDGQYRHRQAQDRGGGRPSRRRLEGGLRRLRDGDDGVLPADVAAHRPRTRRRASGSPTISARRSRSTRAAAAATGRSTATACSARTCSPGTRPGRRATRRRWTCRARRTRACSRWSRSCSAAAATPWRPIRCSQHIRTRVTDEGLIIEVFDIEGSPLFDGPTAEPEPIFEDLVQMIGRVLSRTVNPVAVTGHLAAGDVGRGGPDPWRLSSDRAQLTRDLPRGGRRGGCAGLAR